MERFTKVRNIGKGNMGACALARDNDDGKFFVIKQVDLARLNKKERQQSLNEAKVLSALRHPNIINYVDSFLAKRTDHLCIVMEFADAGDLSGKIKHQRGVRFSEAQVLDWFIQVTLALQHVHRRKILHRDIKTQNIFLTQDGLCKLGDFGIAKTLMGTYDQANTFVGTPYYLSPELILERPYDHMSDVWALGVVLYELMALRHPFNANDMKSLMHRILKLQYDPPPACYSEGLREIVRRILVKDPTQRMRLGEVLELPIVQMRMREWLGGGILPQKYVAAMVRNKLLPPSVLPPASGGALGMTGTLQVSDVPSLSATSQLPQIGAKRPSVAAALPSSKVPTPPPPTGDGRGRPHRLSELANPGPSGVPSSSGMALPSGGIRNLPALRAQHQHVPGPNPRAPNGYTGPQGAHPLPPVNVPAYVVNPITGIRQQPSVRPLPHPPAYPPNNGAADIQAMLARAAQERANARQGRRW